MVVLAADHSMELRHLVTLVVVLLKSELSVRLRNKKNLAIKSCVLSRILYYNAMVSQFFLSFLVVHVTITASQIKPLVVLRL